MEETMTLKQYYPALIVIFLALFVCLLSFRACDIGGKLLKLQGEYETYKKMADQDKQILDKEIRERERAIVFLQNAIKAKDEEIVKKNEGINKKSKELSGLQKEREQMEISGISKDKIIENLDKQVKVWSEKFSIAEGVIKDKDSQIDALKLSFENQLIIANSIQKQLDNEINLRKVAESALGIASFEIKKLKFTSNLKSMIVLVVGGYLAYDLVKK